MFIELIKDKSIRQAQLFLPYALTILHETIEDYEEVNQINIKSGAWGILEYLNYIRINEYTINESKEGANNESG